MADDVLQRIDALERKIDRLTELVANESRNMVALYRRSTALMHMVESVADGQEPRLPKVVRAEIDASISPDAFIELAEKDEEEFIRRYGQEVLKVLKERGIEVITRIGEFAPLKSERRTH